MNDLEAIREFNQAIKDVTLDPWKAHDRELNEEGREDDECTEGV